MAGEFQLQRLMAALENGVKALGNLQQTIAALFPQAGASVVTTATAGTDGAPPAQVAGYLVITVNGQPFKVALYNP